MKLCSLLVKLEQRWKIWLLLLQEKKREEEAGRSDGEVWLTINDAMPSLDLCCDYIADLLDTKEAHQ